MRKPLGSESFNFGHFLFYEALDIKCFEFVELQFFLTATDAQ